MRASSTLVALIGLITAHAHATPADDITARYVSGMDLPLTITIHVNERGDSRIAMGSQSAVLTLDGVSYFLMADLSGTFVVRQDDMIAEMAEQFRSATASLTAPSPDENPEPRYTVIERGTETVAGRTGSVLALREAGQEDQQGLDFVVSADPDLAPIGRALARQYAGQLTGPHGAPVANLMRNYVAALQSVFERGTVIRMGRVMRLDSVETGDLGDSLFTLPSPPLSREQFAARMWGAAPR